jgi:uncharacterized membrane protein
MNNIDTNIIYLLIGPVTIFLNLIGCLIVYILKDDLKSIISHFDMPRINKSLIKKKSIDKDILIPLTLSIVSFRTSLKRIEFNSNLFGSFGMSMILTAIYFVYLGFTRNAPDSSHSSFLFAVATFLWTVLCSIVIIFYYINIRIYKTHKNELDNLITAIEIQQHP